jgi:copper transport protein
VVIRRTIAIVALACVLAVAGAVPAGAHAILKSTTPARGATLQEPPGQVAMRFNEPVEVAFGAIRVYDAKGSEVQTGSAFHPGGDARVVAIRLRPGLAHGGYTATYRVISADSHPVSGGFVFSVGSDGPASGKTVGDLLSGQSSGPVTSVAFSAARALQYAAIALAIGALAVLLLAWLPALATLATAAGGWDTASAAFAARWRTLVLLAGVAGMVSGVLALALQAATAEGKSLWSALPDATEVLSTRFGTVWGLGCLAWLLVLGTVALRPRAVPALRPATVGAAGVAVRRPGLWLAALGAPLAWLALVPALGGHAGVQDPVAVLLPANVLHVVAASAWIGGLATLVFALPTATRRLDAPDRTRLLIGTLGRLSTLALVSVAALLIGGILQSLLLFTAVDDLWTSAYGRAVLIKSLIVAVLLGVGAINRRRTLPALERAATAGEPPGRPGLAIRRAIRVEVALGAVALAVTGALAGYPPPGTAAAGPYSTSGNIGPARAELTVDPARTGPNQIHLYLFNRSDGRQWDGTKELTAKASLPARGIAPIDLHPTKAGPGHYVIGGVPLSPAGDWRLQVISRVSDFDEFRTDFKVPIK